MTYLLKVIETTEDLTRLCFGIGLILRNHGVGRASIRWVVLPRWKDGTLIVIQQFDLSREDAVEKSLGPVDRDKPKSSLARVD